MISMDRANAIATAMGNDENKVKMLLDLTPEEAAEKLNAEGGDFTSQELVEFVEYVKTNMAKNGEVSEEDLENVAGGSAALLVFCGGALIGMMLNKKNYW